ncbi:MAG: ABC transporter substrate-binding protein [Hyphomicrobiales bacterium]
MSDVRTRRFTRRELAGMMLAGIVAATTSYPVAARAALTPAEDYVNRIAGDVMQLANSGQQGIRLRDKFATLLERHINLRGIANFALGPYRSKLPNSKKDEFYGLVGNYAAALFVFYVEDFRGSELEIMSTTKQGKFITIHSAIKLQGGGREQVRWRVVQNAGGGLQISDVNVKGVWLTISMKKRFGDVLSKSKGNFEVLFAELRAAETW